MAQGQDKIARSLLDLEPTAIVEFFLLYFNTVDKENSFIAFHGGSVFEKGIVWQGIEYLPIPVETEGFEVNANGQLARPRIRVSNKDYFVTDLLLNNDDLQFAKIIRKRTFVKYLDDVNFDGGNPWNQADASAEIASDTYVISQKTAENKVFVEFELTSPLDLENFEINNRLIMSRYCSWYYRGNGCNYQGLPLATEDGRKLDLINPAEWSSLGEWRTGVQFNSGDAAYIENKKIIVSDPQAPASTGFAKIWYVCQQNHRGSLERQPDRNENFWLRDGCNKKLDGCKLRFGRGPIEFNERLISKTINYVDFTSRSGSLRYNNIAPNAFVSGSTEQESFPASKIIDLKLLNSADEWRSAGTVAAATANATLTWPEPKNISQIHVYDRNSTTQNFGNALLTFFDENDDVIKQELLPAIPSNGLTPAIATFDPITVKSINISGSGGIGSERGLAEVAVFESISPLLVYQDNQAIPFHTNDFFQISTWIELKGRSPAPQELYSIYHNLTQPPFDRFTNTPYLKGINLYLEGKEMKLGFPIRRIGQVASVLDDNRILTLAWPNDELSPIHLICSGGLASGEAPSSASNGFIRLTNGKDSVQYVLNNTLGEYFAFKNPFYQNGISSSGERLKFGLNDWQYPAQAVGVANPAGENRRISRFMKTHSPIKFGPTALWTGSFAIENRLKEYETIPKNYVDVSNKPEINNSLLGWWDMEPVENGEILAENNAQIKLKLIADDPEQFTSSEIKETSLTEFIALPKQNVVLPFGGFPGTERYG
jgi:lambda family phage minor tail protein L